MFSPIIPHLTEEIYQTLFKDNEKEESIHLSELPKIDVGVEVLKTALDQVLAKYNELGGTDQIAKGPLLVEALLPQTLIEGPPTV